MSQPNEAVCCNVAAECKHILPACYSIVSCGNNGYKKEPGRILSFIFARIKNIHLIFIVELKTHKFSML